jgi:hypothetical protein
MDPVRIAMLTVISFLRISPFLQMEKANSGRITLIEKRL